MSTNTTIEFEKELIDLLKKYNASMVSSSTTIRVFFWDDQGNIKDKIKTFAFNLNKKNIGYAGVQICTPDEQRRIHQ